MPLEEEDEVLRPPGNGDGNGNGDGDADDEIEFGRERARELYRGGLYVSNPERWIRADEEIPFTETLALFGHFEQNESISCPFHGRDSKPSFRVYRRTNDGWCFGCPEGSKYYNSVRFAALKLGVSKIEALAWLEKKFHLPPLADLEADPEEDEGPERVELDFDDLLPLYLRKAAGEAAKGDRELQEDYARILFEAWPERADDPRERFEGGMRLARALGRKAVASALAAKARRAGG